MWKRVAVVVVSVWVLFSGNAWAHSQPNQINNAIVGAGLLFFGAIAFKHDWARFVTLGLGIWLFAFTVLVGADPMTFWNAAAVALVVSILSLFGGEGRRALGPSRSWTARAREQQP